MFKTINSSDGYHDILTEYFAGFLVLAKLYYKKTGENLTIYNMYYYRKKNTIIIKKATSYLELINSGLSNKEIANKLKKEANQIFEEKFKKKKVNNNEKKGHYLIFNVLFIFKNFIIII